MFIQPPLYVFAVLVIFFTGALAGWLYGDIDQPITKQRLRMGVAIAITATWIMTIVAGILIPGYSVSMVIHAIMGGVVGYLFSEEGMAGILRRQEK